MTGTDTQAASNDTATASRGGVASVTSDGSSAVAVTHDTAIADNGTALITDSGTSTATAINTGPGTQGDPISIGDVQISGLTAGAEITGSTGSTAKAEGTITINGTTSGSEAEVDDATKSRTSATTGGGAFVANVGSGTVSNDTALAATAAVRWSETPEPAPPRPTPQPPMAAVRSSKASPQAAGTSRAIARPRAAAAW